MPNPETAAPEKREVHAAMTALIKSIGQRFSSGCPVEITYDDVAAALTAADLVRRNQ